ncbi:MAG: hypothetical protein U0271_41930, partial [Polyangiaceae bacterium]
RCVVGPLAIRSGKIGALGALARSDASLENRLDAVAMLSLSSAPEALEVLGALAARESPDAELRKAAYRALRRAQRRVARQSRAASANKQETAT